MALKFNIASDSSPVQAIGVIDDALPFHYQDHGDHWIVSIGVGVRTWIHHEREPGGVTACEVRGNIYKAVAEYRNAFRGAQSVISA